MPRSFTHMTPHSITRAVWVGGISTMVIWVLYLAFAVISVYVAGIAQYPANDFIGWNRPIPWGLYRWIEHYSGSIMLFTFLGHYLVPIVLIVLLAGIGTWWDVLDSRFRWGWLSGIILILVVTILTWEQGFLLFAIYVD